MTNSRVDAHISVLALAQAGAFTRAQVLAAGGSDDLIRRRLGSGVWISRAEGVYVLRDHPTTHLTQCWIAVLAHRPHAVISHEAAAVLHRLATFTHGPITITRPHSKSRVEDVAAVHQSRRLYPEHVTAIGGLAVTTVPRTLIDLAANHRKPRMEHVVDDALAGRKLKLHSLLETFDDLACRGRPGTRLMRAILRARQPGYVAPQSKAESLMLRVLRQGGLRRPVLQFPHPAPELSDRRVDGAYVPERILIEIDSRRWHTQVAAINRDHDRDYAAKRVGWDTFRFSWDELTKSPDWVVEQLRIALAKAA